MFQGLLRSYGRVGVYREYSEIRYYDHLKLRHFIHLKTYFET